MNPERPPDPPKDGELKIPWEEPVPTADDTIAPTFSAPYGAAGAVSDRPHHPADPTDHFSDMDVEKDRDANPGRQSFALPTPMSYLKRRDGEPKIVSHRKKPRDWNKE